MRLRCSSNLLLLSISIFVGFSILHSSQGAAQGTIFDAPEEADSQAAAEKERQSSDLIEQPDALIEQLNDRAARGGVYLAEAIASFARIGSWPEVNRWLAKVEQVQDQDLLAEMSRAIGPSVLLKISLRSDLEDAQRSAITKLAAAGKSVAESKVKIDSAVAALGSSSVDQSLSAMRVLLGGGNTAVGSLVNAACKQQPIATRDEILKTMLAIDPRGVEAIKQLALYGPAATRENALVSLVRLGESQSRVSCVAALYAQDSTEREREIAGEALRGMGLNIDRGAALRFLVEDLRRVQQVAHTTPNDSQQTFLWSLTADRTEVEVQRCREVLAAYRDVYDASSRLRRLGELSLPAARNALLGELSYQVMIDPDWGMPDQIKGVAARYPAIMTAQDLTVALSMANESENSLAAVALLRIMGSPMSDLIPDELLRGAGTVMTPLVQSVRNAIPRVRFEAAEVIAGMGVVPPYAGSSYVRKCWAEMSRLEDRPVAILVETRPEVILQESSILARLGYKVEPVQTVAQLEMLVSAGGDLRMILAKTRLSDMSPVELIDRVRRLPPGRQLPIVFYGEEFAGMQTGRWDAETRLVNQPATPSAFAEIRTKLARMQRMPELSALDRQHYRRVAMGALDAIAN